MYKILLVEDNDAEAQTLRAALERYGAEHGESFAVSRYASALDLDERTTSGYDLIFMDIELVGGNGMDAAMELRAYSQATPLIFVTSLAQYAVQGYAARALDFLVKPYSYGDFALRMDRAMQAMRARQGRMLTVRGREGLRTFEVSSLVFVDSGNHDVVYHLATGETVSLRGSLRAVEAELGGDPFLKVSASAIVNMAHVRGIVDAALTMSDGSTVWISRANKRRCLETIARYLGGL